MGKDIIEIQCLLSNSEPKQLRHGALLRLCVLILARPLKLATGENLHLYGRDYDRFKGL